MDLAPGEVEQKLTGCRIAVMSASQDEAVLRATDAIKPCLEQNGLQVVEFEEASLVVVVVDDYLRRTLSETNARMRRDGKSWLLFKAGGSVPLVGPIFHPQRTPCWNCLCLQMQEHRTGDNIVKLGTDAARPARAYTTATINIAVGLAALELSRALSAPQSSLLESHVLSFDLNQRAFSQHMVRRLSHCEVCANTESPESKLTRAKLPLEMSAGRVLGSPDGGWRTRTAEQVVAKLSAYVSPLTGIISGIEDRSLADGLPVFTALQSNPRVIGPRQNRTLGRPNAAAGKGMTAVQAKASCLAEAMERYLGGFTGSEPRMRGPWDAVKDAAPHPYSFLNYSEHQYDIRTDWNKTCDDFNWIGERFDESRSIEWTPAWSMTNGALRWLPTRACYYNYVDGVVAEEEENKFCAGDSNGCASGSTLEEAIVQGFFELVERDAVALWWYSRVRRPAFDLNELKDPFVQRVRAHCTKLNLELAVLDITNDLALPVAVAVAFNKATGKSISFGLGSHFDPKIAVSRALSEINQMLTLEFEDIVDLKNGPNDEQNTSFVRWMKNHSVETDPYCLFDGRVSVSQYATPKIDNLKQAVDHCVRVVSDRGFDMIILDLSRSEIDFAAARVVVPGLRHFWARLREGRLYQTPVELGWLTRPLKESELNPVAFFL